MCGDGVVKVKRLQIADFSPRLVTLIGKFANLFGTHIAHGNTGVQFLPQPFDLLGGFNAIVVVTVSQAFGDVLANHLDGVLVSHCDSAFLQST